MANNNFIVQNGLQVGPLTIFAGNGDVKTSGNITTTSNAALQAPAGTSAQRPSPAALGMIRYNSDISSFEGFGAGSAWASLGGVKSVDGKATITAESSAGAGDDVLRFYSGSTGTSTQVMWASGANISILPTTVSTSTTTGALQVAGGAGIAGTMYVGGDLHTIGNIYAANLISVGTSILEVTAPLVYLESSYVYPYDYDIGMYSHFIGGPANVYSHSGVVRNHVDGNWTFFSNVKSEPSLGSINFSDSGILWDPIKAGSMYLANSTVSTSATTGALRVAGGVGIQGNLNVGGNINLVGNVTQISGNAGSFFGNSITGYGALYAGIPSGYSILPFTPVQVTTNSNAYSQMNQQNINSGIQASSDYVVTANNGTDSTFYGDFGIASNTYSYPSLGITAVGPNDTYLLGVGYNSLGPYTGNVGNVVISSSNGMIKLAAGGANIANVIASVIGSGLAVNATTVSTSVNTGALTVAGGLGVSGAAYHGSVYDNGNRVLSTSTGVGNLAISGTSVTLPTTGPGAGSVGSSTAIPVITTDAYGRVASTSTAAVVAPAGTLTGSTLASGVTASSLTSVGTLAGLTVSAAVSPNANATVALGSTSAYWGSAYINSLTATGITVNTGKLLPGANLAIDIGSTTAWFNNIYGKATQALYADLAENYLADRTYHAGTVLMFGGTAEVTMGEADTTRVAGVVSTNPAHLMNGALQGAYVTPLALMGRVPCQVVGPIAKGDLLVSAGWGYAKSNNNAGVGQVIGKALEDFPQQVKGVIEVVVGRV
jgi:hypothetical protein